MFIMALFTIVKLWNQPSGPTTNELINKMSYTFTMECYSVIRKNEIKSFEGK
jgi:hypothetical protein